ncbi:unnamed protein product [marine sediment metagenome]|uniref:Uncharacterized protein n=1 Tax=marine sediment metagenome TaxID=412755 RepID=X0ZUB0_9ZZZZ
MDIRKMKSEEFKLLEERIKGLSMKVNILSEEVVIFREKLSRVVIHDNRKR